MVRPKLNKKVEQVEKPVPPKKKDPTFDDDVNVIEDETDNVPESEDSDFEELNEDESDVSVDDNVQNTTNPNQSDLQNELVTLIDKYLNLGMPPEDIIRDLELMKMETFFALQDQDETE